MSLEILANSCCAEAPFNHSDLMDDKPFCCPFSSCKREFTSKRNLVDHYRGHHQGQRPHVCNFPGCNKSFLRPAHLLIHNRIHTGEKPFMCEYEGCGKRWNQKSALKQHMRSHTGEKPFGCTFDNCLKRFSTSSSCKRHILTHDRTNPVQKRKFDSDSSSSSSSDDELSFKREKFEEENPSSPYAGSPTNVPILAAEEELSLKIRKMDMNFLLN